MFLTEQRQDRCWRLSLSNFELDLLIRSFDESKAERLTERDNQSLDRIWHILWGIRKHFTTKQHRGFCKVCQKTLGAIEVHEHPRGKSPLRDTCLFLKQDGPGWILDLGNSELNLLIRSLDDEQELNDKDNEEIDRMLKILWGIRRRFVVEIPSGVTPSRSSESPADTRPETPAKPSVWASMMADSKPVNPTNEG